MRPARRRVIFIHVFASVLIMIVSACGKPGPTPENPRSYIEAMATAIGGVDRLRALQDVEYQYTYRSEGKEDVSVERYVFDGELSWGKFTKRENIMLPDLEGELIQGYNGKESWTTLDGKLLEDQEALKFADFVRKTDYYWFMMMHKLMDPGLSYAHKGTRTVDGIEYDLIEIGFNAGVGDVQDTYLLYINPKTRLVDQFLFTVLDFGRKDPLLMKVEYEEIDGVKLPAKRKYTPANWEGVPEKEDSWTDEISTNIKFNNGFKREMFEKPSGGSVTTKS